MAKVEIEESELASLQAVNKFVDAGLKNPKTRTTLLGVQKTLNPETVIPELDAADGVLKAVNAVAESVAALKKDIDDTRTTQAEAVRTSELQGRVSKGQDYLRGHGYNEEGIKKVEDLMLQENIASYAAGLALFERLNPPSKPADSSSSRWGTPAAADITLADNKELWESQGDSELWLQKQIAAAKQEFRQ